MGSLILFFTICAVLGYSIGLVISKLVHDGIVGLILAMALSYVSVNLVHAIFLINGWIEK